jgi:hypothetical protein
LNIPPPLVDLLNKTEPGWIVFAHMVPTRIFRVAAHETFKTFRVEQFTRTNSDNMNPQGTWFTKSTHGSDVPGQMLKTACDAATKAQNDFIAKMNKKYAPKKKLLRA